MALPADRNELLEATAASSVLMLVFCADLSCSFIEAVFDVIADTGTAADAVAVMDAAVWACVAADAVAQLISCTDAPRVEEAVPSELVPGASSADTCFSWCRSHPAQKKSFIFFYKLKQKFSMNFLNLNQIYDF